MEEKTDSGCALKVWCGPFKVHECVGVGWDRLTIESMNTK